MTLAILFDSVGVGEWFVLLAVVLIVVGPRRLPETARKIGQYYSKFRRAADSFKRQLLEMDTEFTQTVRDATREVQDAVQDVGSEFNVADGQGSVPSETAAEMAAADGPVPPETAAVTANPDNAS